MNNAPNIHREDLGFSHEVEAGVLFADLDETILNGTAVRMSNEEIKKAGLIDDTVKKIYQARMLGIKVVMATRNTRETIERVLMLRPDLDRMFNDTLSCLGTKSSQIKSYLQSERISPKKAVFIDDTEGELADVERNTDGVIALKTGKTDYLTLKKAA
jgi:hypothetical protein